MSVPEQAPAIADGELYAEQITFPNGREGRTRAFLGRAVRERLAAMTYTDTGEEPTYGTVTQDPATGVITGISTTAPSVGAHHTATWTPITAEELDALRRDDAARWQRVWAAAASAGLTTRG